MISELPYQRKTDKRTGVAMPSVARRNSQMTRYVTAEKSRLFKRKYSWRWELNARTRIDDKRDKTGATFTRLNGHLPHVGLNAFC